MEDYVYHTLAAKPSGELCLKYIFSFGAFAKSPLLYRWYTHSLSLFPSPSSPPPSLSLQTQEHMQMHDSIYYLVAE